MLFGKRACLEGLALFLNDQKQTRSTNRDFRYAFRYAGTDG